MKKRTVITTETREIWVISGGGVTDEKIVHAQPDDVGNVDGNEPLVSTDSLDQKVAPYPKRAVDNDDH
ncbi:MAG: hypothetical protein LC776_03480 [Acidobacteria bacterium]|nr:hypothetical protein [Acidobacteriota bacterium]